MDPPSWHQVDEGHFLLAPAEQPTRSRSPRLGIQISDSQQVVVGAPHTFSDTSMLRADFCKILWIGRKGVYPYMQQTAESLTQLLLSSCIFSSSEAHTSRLHLVLPSNEMIFNQQSRHPSPKIGFDQAAVQDGQDALDAEPGELSELLDESGCPCAQPDSSSQRVQPASATAKRNKEANCHALFMRSPFGRADAALSTWDGHGHGFKRKAR
eukprot:1660113-Amphidinium_carterae.1